MRLERKGVLVLATDPILDGDTLGVGAHVAVLDRAPQAVGYGRVDELAVAEPIAEAGIRQEVRRAVHRLHPAGDRDLGIAGANLGGREHDRLHPRAADPVDRRGARRIGEAGAECRLPGWGLSGSGLEDLAHEDLVDGRTLGESRPLDRGSDRDAAELDRRRAGQRATELADRRPCGADEIDVTTRTGGAGVLAHC